MFILNSLQNKAEIITKCSQKLQLKVVFPLIAAYSSSTENIFATFVAKRNLKYPFRKG